ncbi:SDR family NAD(P)-dependent oxidoreductase [Mucilaginibacter sp. FT3.2]|uniref:SDR family NAD(P)-dependent oxidoreductase n=1 Tax=Mucilaginibacter sp. FT3.2 TaxID=2723090 RepID=UPI00160FF0E3|nr:SDR family NAD(P)-dependent oxidoreductase [Mucilaginibacter sp. FT3.2]MBB6229760.1 hypothetical protein [Mucilaginibacter sp. FT3.2]
MKKIAFITGASSGIGKALALALAKENYNLILTARRKNLLDELKIEIQLVYPVEILTLEMDIRDITNTFELINSLDDWWKSIDLLINNAGLAAGLDHFQDADFNDWNTMIDTNIRGLLAVSQPVSKLMAARRRGHIVNLSSIAGTQVYEKGNIYCATKHAVEAISKSMRIDLLKHRVRVTTISPGAVETEFSAVRFKKDMDRVKKVYEGYEPLKAQDVAAAIIYAISQPVNVNINYIEVTPLAQANAFYLDRNQQAS